MNQVRVIPVLLLKGKGLYKTINFKNPIYLGDPINAVRIFNEKEVDELVLLDIDASKKNVGPNFDFIQSIVSESFMPVGYGGGISTIEQIKKLFDLGIEKVILNTNSFNFFLLEEAVSIYGSQSIVACIDVRKNFFGGYSVWSKSGSIKQKMSPIELAGQLAKVGVGELIIQSIDMEGTMLGFDIELIKSISKAVNVPVIATGGAGKFEDLILAIDKGGASAVAAGSIFVFKGKLKAVLINYLNQSQIEIISKI
jgi:cyclase